MATELYRYKMSDDVRVYLTQETILHDRLFAPITKPVWRMDGTFSMYGDKGKTFADFLADPTKAPGVDDALAITNGVIVKKVEGLGWDQVERADVIPAFQAVLEDRDLEIHPIAEFDAIEPSKVRTLQTA